MDDRLSGSEASFISTHSSGARSERVLKIWDYHKLIDFSYEEYIQSGFSVPKSKPKPLCFTIEESKSDTAPFPINAADISFDGTYVAAVKGR